MRSGGRVIRRVPVTATLGFPQRIALHRRDPALGQALANAVEEHRPVALADRLEHLDRHDAVGAGNAEAVDDRDAEGGDKPREFKTANGLISFLYDLGFRSVMVPMEEGGRLSHNLLHHGQQRR